MTQIVGHLETVISSSMLDGYVPVNVRVMWGLAPCSDAGAGANAGAGEGVESDQKWV